MPRAKGWRPPPPPPTKCATCGRLLPLIALRGLMEQIKQLAADLEKPPEGRTGEQAARWKILHARSALQMLIEDEELFCFGHEPKKRGPRKKEGEGPVDITAPPPAAARKKPGRPPTVRPPLAAVPNE